jgi:hypothetical protein
MPRSRLKPYPLKSNYHDGQLEHIDFSVPGQVTLSVRLDPVWNGGDARVQRLQLSEVKNFDEVSAFFARASSAGTASSMATVIGVVEAGDGMLGLDFTELGYVTVRTRVVREP